MQVHLFDFEKFGSSNSRPPSPDVKDEGMIALTSSDGTDASAFS